MRRPSPSNCESQHVRAAVTRRDAGERGRRNSTRDTKLSQRYLDVYKNLGGIAPNATSSICSRTTALVFTVGSVVLAHWYAGKPVNDLQQQALELALDDSQSSAGHFPRKSQSERRLSSIPRTYVKLLRDKALPPKWQDRAAANIGAKVVTLDSGHMAPLTHPTELAATLNSIAAKDQTR